MLVVTRDVYVSCFFFSSRRRHTRFDCDWSSDVCSSDLERFVGKPRRIDSGAADPGDALLLTDSENLFARAERDAAVAFGAADSGPERSEEHTSELQSQSNLVCRLLLEKKK